MKATRFLYLLVLFTGLFISKAQSQIESQTQTDFLPHKKSGILPHDTFLSGHPENEAGNINLYLSNDLTTSSSSKDAANTRMTSLEIFYEWLYDWFLVGKYVAYHPHKFIHQLPRNKIRNRLKINSKTTHISKKSHSRSKTRKTWNLRSKSAAAIPQRYLALTSSVNSQGITFQELSAQTMPDDFPSRWVWIVICWVDNALKQAEGHYKSGLGFDDVLANTDPALPAVVRSTLRAALFIEDESENNGVELFSDKHVNLTIGWMDYMFIHYDCPLNWRAWLVSTPPFDKGSLLQSKSEDLMTFDISADGSQSIARTLKLTDKHFKRMSKPEIFRSPSLWVIIEEFYSDQLYCQDASGFSTIFPVDLIFADTVSSVLYEIFSAKSQLNTRELYLMEYWLDQAVELLEQQTKNLLNWRELMTLAPNNPKYFVVQAPVGGTAQTPQSEPELKALPLSEVTHRKEFFQTGDRCLALVLQLNELASEMADSEDNDSDYERDGEGYCAKRRAK